jgi:hypothetical protein
MRILLTISVLLLTPPVLAAESSSSGGGKRHSAVGVVRGTINDMRTETVTEFDRVTGGFISTETNDSKSPKVGLRMELGFAKAVDGKTTWAGTPDTTVEMMNFYLNVNLMIYLYKGTISPWISPGVTGGQVGLKHSNGEEKKFQQGWNGQAGIDFMFGMMGLRAGYGYHNVYSDKFAKMDQRRLMFDYHRGFIAFVFETN